MKRIGVWGFFVLGLANAACAQSSVTMYGIVDLTLARGTGSVNDRTQMNKGGYQSNRFGFRGTEDLGGGVSVGFNMEAGFNADDGTGGTTSTNNQDNGNVSNGLVFNRGSVLRIKSGLGELRAGRDYVPQYSNFGLADPLMLVGTGAAVNYTNVITGPTNTRASNGLYYYSPTLLNGVVLNVSHYFGENAQSGPLKDDGTGSGIRVSYQSGAFSGGLAWGRTNYAAGDAVQRNLAVTYDWSNIKFMGMLNWDKRGTLAARGGLLGVQANVTPAGMIRAAYSFHRTNGPGSPEAQKMALSYVHNLSKRTALYSTWAYLKNSGGSSVALNGAQTGPNRSSSGLDLGVRHSF